MGELLHSLLLGFIGLARSILSKDYQCTSQPETGLLVFNYFQIINLYHFQLRNILEGAPSPEAPSYTVP